MIGGAAVLTLACVAATGCWNAIPVGHRALIQILSVDPGPHGRLEWTFFQANPTALANMGSGGGSAGPGGGTTPDQVIPIAVEAPTLAEAYRGAQDLTSRDLYLGQLQQIVLSERLAPTAVQSTIEGLAHTPELDQSQALFAAPGGAAATILAPDPQELFPAAYLEHVTACPTCNNASIHLSLMDAFLTTRTAWGSMLMPEVRRSALGLSVSGAAAYAGPRLVARLKPDDATLLGLVTGVTVKTSLDVPVSGVGLASLRSLRSRAHLRARWHAGTIAAESTADLTGQLVGITPDRGERFESLAPLLDRAVADDLLKRAGAVLASLMADGADPLGLGRALFAADPSAAPSQAAWLRALGTARVHLRIHATLTSEGTVR